MQFSKNEGLDKVFKRYLTSYEPTETCRKKTGDKVYDYYLDFLLKQFKGDLRTVLSEDKQYKRFLDKRLKLVKKKEKYKYTITDNKIKKQGSSCLEYLSLEKKKGKKYKKRRDKKLYKLDRKYEILKIKFIKVISKEKINEELS